MKISIVTAVLNREDTVSQTIESVQAQTYSDIEHIIQDGGSTDNTLKIVHSLADDRTKIVSAPDTGIYDALNKGIARSTGDIIGLLHSDDFLTCETIIEKVARAFADPDVDGVYGDLDYISPKDENRIIRHWKSGQFSKERLDKGWMPPHPTVYLRREVFERFGDYDTSYKISADYDAMLRYLGKNGVRMHYIPEVFVKMRIGGTSNKSLRNIIRKSREDYKALKTNQIGGLATLFMKNASKLSQLISRD